MTPTGNIVLVAVFIAFVTGWVAYNWYQLGKSQ